MQFHVKTTGIRSVFKTDRVEIGATSVHYDKIMFVKSGSASVTVYFNNYTEKEYSANILSVRKFVENAGFCQISSSCALNLQYPWTCYEDTNERGTHYAYQENLNQFRGLLEIDFRISRIYSRAIGVLPPRQR